MQSGVAIFALGILVTFIVMAIFLSQKTTPPPTLIRSDCPNCEDVVTPFVVVPQLSNPTKRAVLIGINYTGVTFGGTSIALYGCGNDARNMRDRLLLWGFATSNITMCVDGMTGATVRAPTRTGIYDALSALRQQTLDGDVAFVWYSGHGLSVNVNGEIRESWFSIDQQYITDIYLNSWAEGFANNTRVFVGSDSCHSGTILDLKYRIEDTWGARSMTTTGLRAVEAVRVDELPPATTVVTRDTTSVRQNPDLVDTAAYSAIFSGCSNNQLSVETGGPVPQGAMTQAFLQLTAPSANPTPTFLSVLLGARSMLSGYNQTPQLSLGRQFDPSMSLASFGLGA